MVYIAAGAGEILNSDRSEASSSWIDSLGLCCEFCLVFLEIFSIFHHQSTSTTSLLSIFACIFWRDTECCWLLGLETGQKLLFLVLDVPFHLFLAVFFIIFFYPKTGCFHGQWMISLNVRHELSIAFTCLSIAFTMQRFCKWTIMLLVLSKFPHLYNKIKSFSTATQSLSNTLFDWKILDPEIFK